MEVRFTIPRELEDDLKSLSQLELSLTLRKLAVVELLKLARIKGIVAKSKLTEEDIKEFSDETNKALAKRFRESLKG